MTSKERWGNTEVYQNVSYKTHLTALFFLFALILSLFGMFFVSALGAALRQLPLQEAGKLAGQERGFLGAMGRWWGEQAAEGLMLTTLCTRHLIYVVYVAIVVIGVLRGALTPCSPEVWVEAHFFHKAICLVLVLLFFLVPLLLGDLLPRLLATKSPERWAQLGNRFGACFLWVGWVVAVPLFAFLRWVSQSAYDLLDIIHPAHREVHLPGEDRELVESAIDFRERIVREIMVPRVDVFALQEETKIKDAVEAVEDEGYSRIPIYGESIDEIRGLLFYRDLLGAHRKGREVEEQPLSSLVKKVLFTPETKKISALLQEFRKEKMHLAIVVDEYGGTAGIVTIEDILEEIVGEIADEYDEEEALYTVNPEGGWIVDARMGILDVEEVLGVTIPQEGEYDTIAGFVFHYAGTIPKKGFTIHQDSFDLRVVASNDRSVEKVWIRPIGG